MHSAAGGWSHEKTHSALYRDNSNTSFYSRYHSIYHPAWRRRCIFTLQKVFFKLSQFSLDTNLKMCFVPYIPCLFSGFYISHQDNGERRDDSRTVLTMNRKMMRQEVIGLTSGYCLTYWDAGGPEQSFLMRSNVGLIRQGRVRGQLHWVITESWDPSSCQHDQHL